MGTLNELNGGKRDLFVTGSPAETADMPKSSSARPQFLAAYIALLLFTFIYCARPEDWIPGLYQVPLAKFIVVLALLALIFSVGNIRKPLPAEVNYLILLALQLFLASVLSPVWRGGALLATLNFAKILIIVVVIAVVVNTLGRLRLLISTQAGSIAVIAMVILFRRQFLLGRLEGIFASYSDPNDLALELVISIPLCIALLYTVRSWIWKVIWASASVVMTFAVFMTGSRGGFLALTITAIACLWTFAIRGRRFGLLAAAAVVAIVAMASSSGVLVARLRGTFNPNDNTSAAYDSAEARQDLFFRSLHVTLEHPLFGVGPGNFAQVSGNWHVTHNSFTQMSSEGGIPALVLYVLVLIRAFKNVGWGTRRLASGQGQVTLLAKALQASLFGFVAGSCFLSVNYEFFPYMLVAYTTALFLIAKKTAIQFGPGRAAARVNLEKEVLSPLSEIPA